MICLDINGVLLLKRQKQIRSVEQYLINCGYDSDIINKTLQDLNPHNFGSVFTKTKWFMDLKDEVYNELRIYKLIAKQIDPKRKNFGLELFIATSSFSQIHMPSVVPRCLKKLYNLDKLILISDASISVKCFLQKYNIQKYFKDIYLSCEFGFGKFNDMFFNKIRSLYNNEVLYYLDDNKFNIANAEKYGINGFWLNKSGGDVKNLQEFVHVMENIYGNK